MVQESTQSQEEILSQCIGRVRSLCQELERAVRALANSDLNEMEAGMAAQESIADKLHSWVEQYGPRSAQPLERMDRAKDDVNKLSRLVRIYSGLLQHSSRSANVRLALCRTYRHGNSHTENAVDAGDGSRWEA
jgi:hypothetical protein